MFFLFLNVLCGFCTLSGRVGIKYSRQSQHQGFPYPDADSCSSQNRQISLRRITCKHPSVHCALCSHHHNDNPKRTKRSGWHSRGLWGILSCFVPSGSRDKAQDTPLQCTLWQVGALCPFRVSLRRIKAVTDVQGVVRSVSGEVETIFDGKEREQDHQLKHMAGRELAVRSLGKVHLPVVKRDMRHYVHDSLNRLRIVTFSKKAVEFRDNTPIFVHIKVYYICLFCDTNILIINEICNISRRFQP